jgi:uncharacterized protein YfaS (alpha-2-macroglobulin family)
MTENEKRSGLARVVGAVATVLVAIFGRWSAPGWMRALGRGGARAGGWARRNRGAAAGVLVGVAALSVGGVYGVRWWKARPKPVETDVAVIAPAATRVQDNEKPHPLILEFSRSAAPLKMIGKVVTAGVEMSPKLDGTWRWANDRQLEFRPKADWPVGEELTIRLAKKDLVAPQIRLSTFKVTAKTAPFTADVQSSEFNQDPTDPTLKKVVVTFAFSHPVDTALFEKSLTLKLEPSHKEDAPKDYGFKVTYDKWKTQAFVHSTPVAIPQRDATMRVTLASGVKAARGGPGTKEKVETTVAVPGLYNFLKISSARVIVVDNEKMEPEHVLVIETTAGVSEGEIKKHLKATLLPKYAPGDDDEKRHDRWHRWYSAEQIGDDTVRQGTPIQLTAIPAEREVSTIHSFRMKGEARRWVHVEIKKGLTAYGGYLLGESWTGTAEVPAFPRQVKLLGEGSLVALSGERRVTAFLRDVPAVRFEIGRVLPEQAHHLFGQSSGTFGHPSFYYGLNEDNLVERFSEIRTITAARPGQPMYEALDLGKYLSDGKHGVFLLKVESWDSNGRYPLGERDQRLILATDLGIVAKESADGSHDVFVASILSGEPVAGARVQVLGKNGMPVFTETTDGAGHVKFPSFRNLERERTATLYLATRGRDASYLPINKFDRNLNFSRFDVGGLTDGAVEAKGLSAYLFSDRGLYRPGEEIRVGMIVRAKDWREKVAGAPLQVSVTDPRGLVVRKERIKLGAAGFEELRHTTPEVAPTGTYTISLHVVKDGEASALLGSTTVRVREFVPDRMKIAVRLSSENPEGWVSPDKLKGRVTLANLFGTPAADRKVRAQLTLSPGMPSFSKYRDYHFFDPKRAKETFSDTLADAVTGPDGTAELDLKLERFAAATYRLTLLAEGYEADGGRSVSAEAQAFVSPLPFVIGYKADGDLGYLPKGSSHEVSLIAVDPTGKRTSVKDLKQVLVELKQVSVLVRQDNGTYKYESKEREITVSEKALTIGDGGAKVALPTGKPGRFALFVRNGTTNETLQQIDYTVAGVGNLDRSLEKNAELEIALKKRDVEPGEAIEMNIKAPYTGAGLITIERERVYSWKWFKTSTTSAVESIPLPEGFEGDGYVSVAFVRDAGSDEVFMSPLSYGVVPFSVSRAKRNAKVTITTPDLAKPGEPFKMRVQTDRPSKIVVFAVDEGILRVADYKQPDPLAYFFQKRALQVRTSQILDLILPEFARFQAALQPGGDGEGEAAIGANLNPFKRKAQKPVAYWSGVIDAGPKEKELVYDVPDYWNGTLRVMAVAVAPDAVGTFDKKSIVRGDFVISPNAPLVLAPGDEVEVPVTIANNVSGSGANAEIDVTLKTGKGIEVVGPSTIKVKAAELREGTGSFTLRATKTLGSASLAFTASMGGKSAHLTTDVSVRPAVPYTVTFQAGHLKDGEVKVPVPRKLYSEYRTLQAGISHLPLGLTHGLVGYLEKFPHGCTEQVTSQAVPAIVLSPEKGTAGKSEFGFDAATSRDAVARWVALLRTRQNEDGAFGQWAANPHVDKLSSVYATHLLLEAKERGYPIPADMLKAALGSLQAIASDEGDSLAETRVSAYATYVLTRSGMVTTRYAAALQKHLEANHKKTWRSDLAAAYLGATLVLLKQERAGKAMLAEPKLGGDATVEYGFYYDPLARDAQLLYLWARHAPELAAQIPQAQLNAVVQPIFKGTYNTFSSAFTILALKEYGRAAQQATDGALGIAQVVGGAKQAITLPDGMLPTVAFSDQASQLVFSASGSFGGYWLVSQRGFDVEVPATPIAQKIEIFREYTDAQGKPIAQVGLGDEIQVHVKVRSLGKAIIPNVAIVDLLPGGFEVVMQERARKSRAEDGDGGGDGEGEGGEHAGGDGEEGGGEDVEGAGDSIPGRGGAREEGEESGGAGGFSLPITMDGSTFELSYGDVREDRVVFYGTASSEVKELVYAVKATNVGTYTIPPILAESMYDRSVLSRGTGGRIKVVKR